ncbi:hypothetical protein VEE42_41620 [Escherichia coli]|nr:hypothetical protein VEE42_41620 [Escherichia coli]
MNIYAILLAADHILKSNICVNKDINEAYPYNIKLNALLYSYDKSPWNNENIGYASESFVVNCLIPFMNGVIALS